MNPHVRLRNLINKHFDENEIRSLCFELGIDYENLPGRIKLRKVESLIDYLSRRRNLANLIRYCKVNRNRVDWPDPIVLEQSNVPEIFISPYGREDSNQLPVKNKKFNYFLILFAVVVVLIVGYFNSGIIFDWILGLNYEGNGVHEPFLPPATSNPSSTSTESNTPAPSVTPTNTPTPSFTPTNAFTPTVTPTNTSTPSVTPTLPPVSLTLTPSSDRSGQISSNGEILQLGLAGMCLGDLRDNIGMQTFYYFDISTIPIKSLVLDATLRIDSGIVIDDPIDTLGKYEVHIYQFETLDAGDLDGEPANLVGRYSDLPSNYKPIDIREFLQVRVDLGQEYIGIRLQFEKMTDNNFTDNYWCTAPDLTVIYQP